MVLDDLIAELMRLRTELPGDTPVCTHVSRMSEQYTGPELYEAEAYAIFATERCSGYDVREDGEETVIMID